MLIGLLDPRWREQQNKTVDEKKQQDEIFAVGMLCADTMLRSCVFSSMCQVDCCLLQVV